MTQIVARKNPVAFKTQAIAVTASAEVLRYEPTGSPLSFAQIQERRVPLQLQLSDPNHFNVVLANLGSRSICICTGSSGISACWYVRTGRTMATRF